MAFDNQGGNFAPRSMVQGSWKCAECGKEITELPFEPAQDRPVHCRDCWRSKNQNNNNDRRRDFAPREMVKGSWKCSECGKEITELPFKPAPDKDIYCGDCWKKKRSDRF